MCACVFCVSILVASCLSFLRVTFCEAATMALVHLTYSLTFYIATSIPLFGCTCSYRSTPNLLKVQGSERREELPSQTTSATPRIRTFIQCRRRRVAGFSYFLIQCKHIQYTASSFLYDFGFVFKNLGCVSSRSLFGKTVNMASWAYGVLDSDCTKQPWFVQRPKTGLPLRNLSYYNKETLLTLYYLI